MVDLNSWEDALLVIPVPPTVCYTKYLVCVQCINTKNQWFQASKASKNNMSATGDIVTPTQLWDRPPVSNLNDIFEAVGWYRYPSLAVPENCNGNQKKGPLQWALVRIRR